MLVARSTRPVLQTHSSRSRAFRHVSSLHQRPEVLRRHPQPTVSSGEGGHTLRLRQHGNKSLPLPPLLDPIRTAARERYTAPKVKAEQEEQTELQKQLAANPFARALATPIRQSHLTNVRLPTHFLQPFAASITNAPSTPPPTSDSKRPTRPITVSLLPSSRRDLPPDTAALPASTYVLRTRSALQHLGKKRNWVKLIGERMKEQYARRIGKKHGERGIDVGKEWVWDPATCEVVLARLREEVVRCFEVLLAEDDDPDWEWIGPPLRQWEVKTMAPGQYAAILTSRGRGLDLEENVPEGVPVYGLKDMLDAEAFKAIDEKLGLDSDGAQTLLIMPDRRTLPLELALHRLAIYLEPHQDGVGAALPDRKKEKPERRGREQKSEAEVDSG